MSTADPNLPLDAPTPDGPTAAPNARGTPAESRVAMTPIPTRRSLLWMLTLAAGVLAGVGSWLAGETETLEVIPKQVLVQAMGGPRMEATTATERIANDQTAVRVFGVFGAAMGLALGLAGGLAGHSPRRSGIAAGVGLVVGGVVGALAPLVVLPIFHRAGRAGSDDMIAAMLMHAGLWMGVGAVSGLAFGIGLGGRKRLVASIIGGAVGAVIGAIVYEFVGAIAFPLDKTASPISMTWQSRLLARLLIATSAAVGIALAVADRREASASSPPAP